MKDEPSGLSDIVFIDADITEKIVRDYIEHFEREAGEPASHILFVGLKEEVLSERDVSRIVEEIRGENPGLETLLLEYQNGYVYTYTFPEGIQSVQTAFDFYLGEPPHPKKERRQSQFQRIRNVRFIVLSRIL